MPVQKSLESYWMHHVSIFVYVCMYRYLCVCIYIYIYIYIYIVYANGPGLVIPKTKKRVLDASLFNTQDYKVLIKGKWETSSALPYTSV